MLGLVIFLPAGCYWHRAYDRVAIKFRGVDADIDFSLDVYKEDISSLTSRLSPTLGELHRSPVSGDHNGTLASVDAGWRSESRPCYALSCLGLPAAGMYVFREIDAVIDGQAKLLL